jgi:hypothetical protein
MTRRMTQMRRGAAHSRPFAELRLAGRLARRPRRIRVTILRVTIRVIIRSILRVILRVRIQSPCIPEPSNSPRRDHESETTRTATRTWSRVREDMATSGPACTISRLRPQPRRRPGGPGPPGPGQRPPETVGRSLSDRDGAGRAAVVQVHPVDRPESRAQLRVERLRRRRGGGHGAG